VFIVSNQHRAMKKSLFYRVAMMTAIIISFWSSSSTAIFTYLDFIEKDNQLFESNQLVIKLCTFSSSREGTTKVLQHIKPNKTCHYCVLRQ
jgi:hypothetical protein